MRTHQRPRLYVGAPVRVHIYPFYLQYRGRFQVNVLTLGASRYILRRVLTFCRALLSSLWNNPRFLLANYFLIRLCTRPAQLLTLCLLRRRLLPGILLRSRPAALLLILFTPFLAKLPILNLFNFSG